ncbi:hypothetical protein B0O99DRAFT_625953 [Bisporella sp. PMI_857]|nr:hypothetical protein B0O99DRAFT_625953 [Bisporella sp. PMI_857]
MNNGNISSRTAGRSGACTEQFSLGSVFSYIGHRIEIYYDQNFGEDYGLVIGSTRSLELDEEY